MKILHLSCVRKLSKGQRNQLTYEHRVSKTIDNLTWDVVAITHDEPRSEFEKRIPLIFRNIFFRNIYAWMYMIRERKSYDYILCRYMPFDIFSIFLSWTIENRLTIHHAKEVSEILSVKKNALGKIASFIEDKIGKISLSYNYGIIGVTNEICDHENARLRKRKPVFTYPNGIDTGEFFVAKKSGLKDQVVAIFICGKFSSWHGLEKLFESAQHYKNNSAHIPLKIHLVGQLTDEQCAFIESSRYLSSMFIIHGVLDFPSYKHLIEESDIGLASFNLEEKNLKEAATLKVREYLALGLPVYSGHTDTAFTSDFPFYKNSTPDISEIYDYGRNMKSVDRTEVKEASKKMIEKRELMLSLIGWLEQQKNKLGS